MNRVIKRSECTLLNTNLGFQILPNESLKGELKLSFKLLIKCSSMKISENLQFRTIQEMAKHNF